MGYGMSAYSACKKQVNFNNKDLPLDEEIQSDDESINISRLYHLGLVMKIWDT